jgi:hypothetical protein
MASLGFPLQINEIMNEFVAGGRLMLVMWQRQAFGFQTVSSGTTIFRILGVGGPSATND